MSEVHHTPRWLSALTAFVLAVLLAAAGFALVVAVQNLPRIGV